MLYVVLIQVSKKYLQYFCLNNPLEYYHRTAMFLYVHVAYSYYWHLRAHISLYVPPSFYPSTRFVQPLSNHSFIHLISRPSIQVSIHLSTNSSVYSSIHLPSYPFIHPLIRLVIIHPSILSFIRFLRYLFIHPSRYLFIYPPTYLSIHQFIYPAIYSSTH